MTADLYLGTYANNGGAGLHPLRAGADGSLTLAPPSPAAANASFGTYSAAHDLYYLVDEQADGTVNVLRRDGGGWQTIARLATGGAEPCYVALDHDQRWLGIANYGSGSIALFRLDERTGIPIAPASVRGNRGSGPVADRQDGPHAHCVCFDRNRRWLYHADLGTDQIIAHPFDVESGFAGEPAVAFQAPPGTGPRHIVFHPILPLALLASELASTLTVLRASGATWSVAQTVSTLPAGFAGDSLAGHLSLNAAGERVYVTNRGHDSVAVFGWDTAGTLHPMQHMPSGGASPRAFVLLEAERRLILANEQGCNVTAFALLPDGTLAPQDGEVAAPGAVFLMVAS
jgi:6-phosphogluconolactonase